MSLQSKTDEALSSEDVCVQQLRRLWEKTQLKGAHSFELAMTQTAVPQKKVRQVKYYLSLFHYLYISSTSLLHSLLVSRILTSLT